MSHTSTSIALSWSTPLVSNGILLHYTITFLPLNAIPTDGVIQTTCMTTGTVTHNIPDSIEISAQHNTTVLTGLLKHTPYSFGITASTSAGEGPPSTDLCTATTLQDGNNCDCVAFHTYYYKVMYRDSFPQFQTLLQPVSTLH